MTSQIRNSVAVFVSLPLRSWICPLSPQPFLPRDTITQHNFNPTRSEQRGGLAGWRLVSYSIDQRPWKCPIMKYKVSLPRERKICLLSNGRDLVMRMPDVFVTSLHEAFHFQNNMATAGILLKSRKYSRIFRCSPHLATSDEDENQLHDI